MNKKNVCSFCKKTNLQVERLISGSDAAICNECLDTAIEAINKEKSENITLNTFNDITPKKLKAEFDKYVIGQDSAKKQLAVVVSNHYKRLINQKNESIKEGKVNLLMIGPTSSGKTLLLRVLQSILKKQEIPIAFADATTLTEAGYVGEDVDSILLRLLQEADFNVQKAQKGIIFIDEIDKIASKSGGGSISRDISGEGVQQALLGVLQGKTVNVNLGSKKSFSQESVQIDTSDILFICAGAFSGLEKIIESRTNQQNVGFHGKVYEKQSLKNYDKVETEDLIKFGIIPEFVGRLPSIVTLRDLTKEQLVKVLTEPENSIVKQYEELFKNNNSKITFTDCALSKIAENTLKKKVSTRGLKNTLESLLTETMFELEDNLPCEVFVDEESVKNNKPKVIKSKKEAAA